MNKNILLTTALFSLLAVSCAPKSTTIQSDDTEPLTTQGSKVLKMTLGEDTVRLSELVKSIDIIPLQTTDESLINQIQTVKYDDGMFFVFDYMGKRILKFDRNGQFKGRIGNNGRGRGEYLFPNLMGIDTRNRTVLVSDNSKSLHKYTYDGEYISTTDLSISASTFEVTDDFYIFYTGKTVNFKPGQKDYWGAELMIMDRNNTDSIRRYIPVDKELYPIGEGHTTISESMPLCPSSDSYTLHYNFTDYIFSIDRKTGDVKVKYTVDYGKDGYNDDLGSMPAMDALSYVKDHSDKIGWTHGVVETDDLLFFFYYGNKFEQIYFNDKKSGKVQTGPFLNELFKYYGFNGAIDSRTIYGYIESKKGFSDNIAEFKGKVNGLERLDSVNDADNPILVIYHF